jgi:BirA family biotin operon repressor/biotin-[acetyl-CoA-carboxylase] ligase
MTPPRQTRDEYESGQMDRLTSITILDGLATRWLGRRVESYETTGSTNAVAKTLAAQGAAEGTLVIADEQTAGRGRLDRRWLAPPGTSLLFSLIFRPQLELARAVALTMICGLGVRQAIRELTALPAQLKWPNDIVLHGRKAGGILTEAGTSGQHLDWVVVGIGLNVNLAVAALPAEFGATSLQHELGRPSSRLKLLQQALLRIEQRYERLQAGQSPVHEWSTALETLGERVQLCTAGGAVAGLAEAVDDQGALLLRLDDGQLRKVWVGDMINPPK